MTVVSAAAPVHHALPPSPLNYPAAPSAHVHNTFPPPYHTIDTIVTYEMLLTNVNGSLTLLSAFRGFRNFITAKAQEIGITCVIQRYHHRDVYLKFEGTPDEVNLFKKFLHECRNQGISEMLYVQLMTVVSTIRLTSLLTVQELKKEEGKLFLENFQILIMISLLFIPLTDPP